MNIAIIGAGNGGLALGAHFLEKGAYVSLYDKFNSMIDPIIYNNNNITVRTTEGEKDLQFSMVTTDLQKAIHHADYIFIVTPAFAHKEIAANLTKYISKEQSVILCPGRTGGALVVKRIMEEAGHDEIVVAESDTLLFACRKSAPTSVSVYGVKSRVGLAALPSNAIDTVIRELRPFIPSFFAYPNVLFTSLNNIGAVLHPAPFLLNISKVENEGNFKYYYEGITPFIASFLERLDQERLSVAEHFAIKVPSTKEWLKERYCITGNTLYEVIQNNPYYKNINAPTEIESRYVMEDIPMSLIPLTELARVVSVKTPHMDSIIKLAVSFYKKDFLKESRSLKDMGLNTGKDSVKLIINK